MVDDTSQTHVQDTNQTTVVPSLPETETSSDHQSTPADNGQIPPNWPSQSEASSSSSVNQQTNDLLNTPNWANDQTATQSAKIKDEKQSEVPITQDQPKVEVQTTQSEIGQVEETKQTWPNSTNLANSDLNASPSAQIETLQTSISQESDSTKLANQQSEETKLVQTETPSQTEEKPIESKEHENISQPQETTTEPFPEEAKSVNLVNQASETQVEKQPEQPTPQQVDIDVQPAYNQASQVQSEMSDSALKNDTEKTENPLASLDSMPLESPQIAPNQAIDNSSSERPFSFGDILEGKTASNLEPSQEPTKSFSFGDLLKEAQNQDKTNIPDDLFEIKDTRQETVLQPQTQPSPQQNQSPQQTAPQNPLPQQTPSQSSPQVSPPITPPPPSSSNPTEPEIIEKIVEKPVEVIKEVIKEIPVVNQEEVNKQADEKIKSTLDQKRILANQARSNKKSKHLNKVMELARNTDNISNEDIQRLLHVSQSTATNYLSELTKNGMLNRVGIRGGAKYTI